MTTPSKRELTKQFNRVQQWIGVISAAATDDFDTALLLAIGSRETNLDPYYQSHSGDFGHGYSMWQIDIGSYPDFVQSGDWKDVGKAVAKAAEVLGEKLAEVKRMAIGDNIDDAVALRIAIAAYNCGSGPAYRWWKRSGDPDRGTTGKDYSVDVLRRKAVFEELLPTSPDAQPNVSVPTDLPGNVNVPAVSDQPTQTDSTNLQSLVSGHADSAKAILGRAGLKIARWLAMLWATTYGKVFIIIVSVVILTEIGYNVIKYWPKVKELAIRAKDFALAHLQ